MNETDRDFLLFLSTLKGISVLDLRRLCDFITKKKLSPITIFHSDEYLRTLKNIMGDFAFSIIKSNLSNFNSFIKRCAVWKQSGINVLSFFDAEYPKLVRYFLGKKSPLFLFYEGCAELLSGYSVAVIGTRAASAWGLANCERITDLLARAGAVILSGAASGIDSAAHSAAIREKGRTIIVPGHPLLKFKPKGDWAAGLTSNNHFKISQFLPDASFEKSMPVLRNSIVSALCSAVIVAECGFKGGSSYVINDAIRYKKSLYYLADSKNDINTPPGNKSLSACGGKPIDISDESKLATQINDICNSAREYHKKILSKGETALFDDENSGIDAGQLPLEF